MRKRWLNKFTIVSAVSIVVFFALWWFLTAGLKILPTYIMPDPFRIFQTLIRKFSAR